MGTAAYNRGSACISEQIEREVGETCRLRADRDAFRDEITRERERHKATSESLRAANERIDELTLALAAEREVREDEAAMAREEIQRLRSKLEEARRREKEERSIAMEWKRMALAQEGASRSP